MTQTLERPLTAPGPTFRQLLLRVVLAGAIAGTFAGVFSLLVTERTIRPALDLEEARALAGGAHDHGDELFSRSQQLVGGFLGVLIAGVVFGVLFAAVYGRLRHRLPGRSDARGTAVLAAIGFAVFALLPALKIPANPPAVGNPETVGTRTAIYGTVLLVGVIGAVLVAALVGALRSRGAGEATAAVAATLTVAVLLVLVLLVVPDSPDVIPDDVPAAVVWNFRLASLGQLAVLWATLGLASGALLGRLEARVGVRLEAALDARSG